MINQKLFTFTILVFCIAIIVLLICIDRDIEMIKDQTLRTTQILNEWGLDEDFNQ